MLIIFLRLICLLLAAVLVFLAIILIDACNAIHSVSWLVDSFRANVKLGFVFILFVTMRRAMGALLALVALIELAILEAKGRARSLNVMQ